MTVEWLYLIAVLLGLLAFFEPCTIATHTLFSQRIHKNMVAAPGRELLFFLLARTLLTALLLFTATTVLPRVGWTKVSPAVPLLVIGSLYLVTRFIYLPIPHLEFYRLLPGRQTVPYAVQLGFTLPACTLPLVCILIGGAVTVGSPSVAGVSGFLFGAAFSCVTVLTAITGINPRGACLLSTAAKTTPYATAFFLTTAAFYLLF